MQMLLTTQNTNLNASMASSWQMADADGKSTAGAKVPGDDAPFDAAEIGTAVVYTKGPYRKEADEVKLDKFPDIGKFVSWIHQQFRRLSACGSDPLAAYKWIRVVMDSKATADDVKPVNDAGDSINEIGQELKLAASIMDWARKVQQSKHVDSKNPFLARLATKITYQDTTAHNLGELIYGRQIMITICQHYVVSGLYNKNQTISDLLTITCLSCTYDQSVQHFIDRWKCVYEPIRATITEPTVSVVVGIIFQANASVPGVQH